MIRTYLEMFGDFRMMISIALAIPLALASCSATSPEAAQENARAAETYFLRGEQLADEGRAHEAIDAYHAAIRAAP